ncbi:TetR/AcrR family transcriptional regulator [Levilactobacillus yiduensis]|uniref:TetR/AcrR family transcriptional regulator n=1 Tax=Levilactobacillus yiduensis TaxID=2953880 RepID=UPI000EF32BEB|nr:TetR/AcrR family transcriptional regulator [Levilactobacillus yiduensis]AYM04080.1 TetR/AcrR family transcriptional regulator [Levilactobacillus brevis]
MEPNIFKSYRDWLEHEQMPKGKKAALTAAMALFSENGFDGTSTVQVAEEAGVSQATIFKYFHTKQDLLLAIVRPVMEHFFPAYRDEFFQGITACETLPEMVKFIVTDRYHFIKENQEAVKIIVMEMMTSEEMRQLFVKLISNKDFDFLSELMKNFARTGELRKDIDAAGIVRILAGQLMVYVIQSSYAPVLVHGEAQDLQIITEQIVRTIKK